MGLRKQTIFLSIISSLASPWVAALGLGEIKLKSTLNQPLNAEIALTQTKDLTEREILVGLASQADFARVGVDKPLFLGDLKFQVVMESSKGPYVQITSSKPVVEPYLNFIVQAQWPSGKLLREYTVLVDLPTYGGDEADAIAPAVSRSAVNTPKVSTQINQVPQEPRPRVSRPAATVRPKPPTPAPAKEPSIAAKPSGDTYGPVAGNDTLWKIARENRPAGASIQQTMLAIQQLNPDAFINGNINLLRKGQTLRLPAGDAATQVAADEAARQVAANTTPRKNVTDDTAGPQLDASKTVPKTEARTTNVEGRVKLSSSNSADGAKSGRGAGTDKGNKEALTNELTITKEELDAKSRETADLNARLKAMDEQIENTEKLIQVNSEEMLKLELAIEKNKQLQSGQPAGTETPAPATAEVPASIGPDGKVVAPTAPDPTATQVVPVDPAATQPAPVATEVAPPPAEVKPVTPAPAKPASEPQPKGLVDQLMDNIAYVGGGLAVVLGLALFALKRRRRDEDAPEPWVESSDSASSGWDADFTLPAFDDDKTVSPAGADDTTQFHAQHEAAPVKLETDDVVSESDIHIGFKDYGTAEKLLLSSLEQDPANSRVLLKLLEVYSRRQDINSFDRQYAKLRAFCDDDAKERAEQLRSYIDNAPPFDSQKYSEEAFIAAVNGEEGVQGDPSASSATPFALGAVAAAGAVGLAASQSQAFDTQFNFDATLDETVTTEVSDYTADQAEPGENVFTLDFEPEPVGLAPSADRRSLAEVLAGEDGEEGLDLSDFDDLSFDKSAAPVTSLDDEPVPEESFAELDFTLDEDDLSEADFELNEDALAFGSEFDAPVTSSLQQDETLDAGFDDLDAPAVSVDPIEEPEDEFADLDLSGLDYEMTEQDLDTQLDEVDALAEGNLAGDFEVDEQPDTDDAISSALAELDDFTVEDLPVQEQTDNLDLYGDIGELSSELDEGIASEAKRKELEALLDFEDSFAAADASGEFEPSGELDEGEEASTPTLVMTAISEQDLPSADLDFDELDADLGALAADFEGDLADLDEFDAPAVAGVSSALMDEPVTQFGELDDVDPAEILGDGPKERPDIDLEGFDDTVTFAIEDPLTELDEFDVDTRVQGVAGELGTAVNLDNNEDLVEFEDLDNLDNLADLDLMDEDQDVTSLELDDDALVIPPAVASAEPEFKLPDFDPESDDDSDLGALCDGDELDTKLDLLRAFVDMGDEDSARHTLEEILEEGTEEQRKQANALMARIA